MKIIKKHSLLLVASIIFTSVFCISVSAEEKEAFIVDTNTVYAEIPDGYDFYPYFDGFYFTNENVDSIQILQAKNFNVENGVKKLNQESAFDLYKYYFNIDTEYYDYQITQAEIQKVNGISSYVLSGEIVSEYTECDELEDESGNIIPGDFCNQYFIVYIFATKENTIIVSYESGGEKTKQNVEDAEKLMKNFAVNGTYFDNEKLSVSHNFINSPDFEVALQTATDSYDPFSEMDEEIWTPVFVMMFLFFVMPVLIIILIAVINIVKYSKNKKILKRYELTYGSVPSYNMPPQNFNGYGYNSPVNQPYQPPVPSYQQNPINQNIPQTPSYVSQAVNNLDSNQPQQPIQTPETQANENNESVGE